MFFPFILRISPLLPVFVILLYSPKSFGQVYSFKQITVHVGKNILIENRSDTGQFIEPCIAVDPLDTNHLVVASMTSRDPKSGALQGCVIYNSFDGGKSWQRTTELGQSCSDPWLTLTENGSVLTLLGRSRLLPDTLNQQLLVFFSSDRGMTWAGSPQSLGGGHDYPRSVGKRDGTIYISSGITFLDQYKLNRFGIYVGKLNPGSHYVQSLQRIIPNNLNQQPDAMAVTPDGSLYITYTDIQRPVEGRGFRGRAGELKSKRVWSLKSSDEARNFSLPAFITEAGARFASLAIDTARSSKFFGKLYVAFMGDEMTTINVSTSSNNGEWWSAPVSIESSSTTRMSRMFPQVAVNQAGVLGVAWLDKRDDPNGDCYAPYIAFSVDGGVSFTEPIKIATTVSCPGQALTGRLGGRWPLGGDYFGLAAGGSGSFHLVWSDARNGKFQLMTSVVKVNLNR